MSAALIVLGGIVYIALSFYFRFTPRLRVIVGLVVGSLLSGVVATWITRWLGEGTGAVAEPLGRLFGQSAKATAGAIPTVIALALAIVVVVFLRGRGGKSAGAGKAGKASGGKSAGGLATVALVCAVLLPMVAGSIGSAIRSVTS